MFLNIFITFSIIWYLIYRWRNRAMFKLAKQLHNSCIGVSLPLIGQSYLLRGDADERMKTIKKFGRKATEIGGVMAFWHAHRLLILVTDAEVADIMLKTCLEKDDMMKFFTALIGNGSIFAPVITWRSRRKATSPVFNMVNLKHFTTVFARQSKVLRDRLRKAAGKGPFKLWSFMTAYTLDSVCESTFGLTVDAQSDKNHPFPAAFNHISKMAADFMFKPYLHNTVLFKLLCYFSGSVKNANVMHNFVDNVIKEKQEQLQQLKAKKTDINQKNLKSGSSRKDIITFLEMFMQSSEDSKKLTDLEIREEAIVIIIAATDTSAVAASFTTMMLARYPEVQERVYQEVQEVLGHNNRSPTTKDLPRLKYLEAVIKETMRLYPPVPLLVRKMTEDVTLPSGVTLLEGCGVIVNVEALHRNSKYWGADADSFKPERFLDAALPHPGAYIPFSHGPRGCLGFRYAMMSMKTALATLLQQYRVLPAEHSLAGLNTPYDEISNPLQVHYSIMLKEAQDFTIQLESRQ